MIDNFSQRDRISKDHLITKWLTILWYKEAKQSIITGKGQEET